MCKYADLRRTTKKDTSRMNEMINLIPVDMGKCYTCMSNYMNKKLEPGESRAFGTECLEVWCYEYQSHPSPGYFQNRQSSLTRARTHTSVSVFMIHPCMCVAAIRTYVIYRTNPSSTQSTNSMWSLDFFVANIELPQKRLLPTTVCFIDHLQTYIYIQTIDSDIQIYVHRYHYHY